jgi:mRNA-degrading endonuclease toxin of MazEF toxin-antitoxin module
LHFNRGDVYWTNFPYEEIEDSKVRPGIILDVAEDEVELLVIKVSHSNHQAETVVQIEDYLRASLDEKSYAIITKIRVLPRDRIHGFMGTLSDMDLLNVLEKVYDVYE